MNIMADSLPLVPYLPYCEAIKHVRTGDILLCSGESIFSRAIKALTNSIWTHTGFIWCPSDLDRPLVMESVESIGVRCVPLSSYAENYNGSGDRYDGAILIARHVKFKKEMVGHLTGKAIDLLGHKYDKDEIVKIMAKMFSKAFDKTCELPDDDGEYICSEYVRECFQECSIGLKTGCGYVTPCDIATDEDVRAVCMIV